MTRVAVAIIPTVFGTVMALHGSGQAAKVNGAETLSFEVVSIKPNHSDKTDISMNWGADTCSIKNVTAKRLVALAYGVNVNEQIAGAPGWANSDEYDVEAKMDDALRDKLERLPFDQRAEQLKILLQTMLADRFQLGIRHDTKEVPAFALVVAKNGPKLMPTTLPPDDPANARKRTPRVMSRPARGQVIAKGQPIVGLLGILSRELGGRIVLDETGLKGEYDFTLQWTPDSSTTIVASDGSLSPGIAPIPDTTGPSIFTALQEQLGLRLESRKAQRDVIVITHIERPSGN